MAREMHLLGHMCTGPTNHHFGSWRHPDSDAERVLKPERYEELARIYERGMFDGIFIVDHQCLPDLGPESPSGIARLGGQLQMLDPLLVLAIMARVTQHLGLAATVSTSLNNAFQIARSFASLDHLSGGRAGWNIVTSTLDQEARNYGYEGLPPREDRYDIADETVEACNRLWQSWQPGALKVDREAATFADPELIRYVEYEGKHVRTRGALTTPHSPQGRPVFMQAGASERGLAFAARWAECVFTHQHEPGRMQAFYAEVKDRVERNGRLSGNCAILPAIEVFVGESDSEAQEFADYVDSFATPEMGLDIISATFRCDLSQVPLDTPIDQVKTGPKGPNGIAAYENMMSASTSSGRTLTLGECAILQATTWWSPRLVGSAKHVADQLQEMFESRCCDGFVITQALSPRGVERFVDLVIPELQARGIFRKRYKSSTFRGNLLN